MTVRTGSRLLAGNLPAEATSFVGRRQEVTATKRMLRRHRLVTLTGGPGVGKTRLAMRVAARLADAFPGGVWLVELAALEDDKFLVQAVADALGIRDQSSRPAMDVLVAFLHDKDLMLVLDNCEHLLDACAMLVHDLLRAAPRLRVLATSRQALRSGGERLFEVPPLPTPDTETPVTTRTLAHNASVRLFATRAALARPGFTVDARNRAAVACLCRRLEGIPLAIELTAARVRALSLEQILTRLENSYFELLAEASRTALPRVQTLHTAITWSFDLCSEQEQRVWARASVFTGGFDLRAAEEVCTGTGIARQDVLELVAGLMDKSVLIRIDQGETARYRMLESIRQYGEQRLASSGHQTAVRLRHRDHYRLLAERAERAWVGPDEQAWFVWFLREHANLRTALEFCLTEPGQARAGVEIAACLWNYWTLSGWFSEARHWLDSALEVDREPSPARAKAFWVNGWLALLQADWAAGLSLARESRVLAERVDDEHSLAQAIRISGVFAFFRDDIPRAVALFEDALPGLWATGDRGGVWINLLHLVVATAANGDPDRSVDCGEECLSLVEDRGGSMSKSWALWVYGLGRWITGDRQQADRLTREALRTGRPLDDQWGTAHCLEILAWNAAAERHKQRAARLLGAADRLWRSTGSSPAELRHLAPAHELCRQRTHQALGNEAFTALFSEGTQFTSEHAIAYALSHQP
ncbi:putative ATPase [Kibdelosporangium banguiense]|uniref:ATPase n=1 Tax=Kibdelosporangium banguiense TaxID=1365924 RepID=A0ABS4TGI0_9PSEU|nr:AAA family ATPase [Kibdelosporangium banguiense]MBP2323532.1 putative ATPase [Kibdelosporangium banguiense]